MRSRHVGRYLSYLCLLGMAGLFIAGCVIQDPPALGEIAKARKALDDARKAGASDRAPDKFAELEKRYLQARGVFYACNDAEAIRIAQSISSRSRSPAATGGGTTTAVSASSSTLDHTGAGAGKRGGGDGCVSIVYPERSGNVYLGLR